MRTKSTIIKKIGKTWYELSMVYELDTHRPIMGYWKEIGRK
jgi:hypothetical protein